MAFTVGQRVKIIYHIPGDVRYKAGEIGEVIENTYPEKYDLMVKLPDVHEDGRVYKREMYFYNHEVELIS